MTQGPVKDQSLQRLASKVASAIEDAKALSIDTTEILQCLTGVLIGEGILSAAEEAVENVCPSCHPHVTDTLLGFDQITDAITDSSTRLAIAIENGARVLGFALMNFDRSKGAGVSTTDAMRYFDSVSR